MGGWGGVVCRSCQNSRVVFGILSENMLLQTERNARVVSKGVISSVGVCLCGPHPPTHTHRHESSTKTQVVRRSDVIKMFKSYKCPSVTTEGHRNLSNEYTEGSMLS